MRIAFEVEGPLHPYRQTTTRMLWLPRNRKYAEFKRKVLAIAMEEGWKGRAVSEKSYPPKLSVQVFWKRNPRFDWPQAYKAIEDSIFKQDRFVKPGPHSVAMWDTGAEKAVVVIEFES